MPHLMTLNQTAPTYPRAADVAWSYDRAATYIEDHLYTLGITVSRRDAFGNIFLKMDHGVMKTIKLGDAPVDDRFKYRYNVCETSGDRYDPATKRFFYGTDALDALCAQLTRDHTNRRRRYGADYDVYQRVT